MMDRKSKGFAKLLYLHDLLTDAYALRTLYYSMNAVGAPGVLGYAIRYNDAIHMFNTQKFWWMRTRPYLRIT